MKKIWHLYKQFLKIRKFQYIVAMDIILFSIWVFCFWVNWKLCLLFFCISIAAQITKKKAVAVIEEAIDDGLIEME